MRTTDSASVSTRASATRSLNQCWTNEKEARLISLYGMHRLLWDSRHPEYYKKDSREHAIKAIAQGLDNEFTVVNVKDKIKSLRDYFVKELRKEVASKKSSTARPYVSRWEHFRSWDFLRCVICCDSTVQLPSTASLPSGTVDVLHCGVKQEHQDVHPVFSDARGPCVILPASPEFSSDEDEEQSSSENHGSSSPLPPPQPVPQTTESNGFPPQDHAFSRSQPKIEQKRASSSFSHPRRDSGMSPNPPQPKRARPSPSSERPPEIHHDAMAASCSGGQTSCAKGPAVPSPVAPCAASFPVGPESRNPTWMMGRGGGADGLAPFELDLPREDEEELFCRQLFLELRQMERYRRDLVRLRIRQLLFEIKYMGLQAFFHDQGGN